MSKRSLAFANLFLVLAIFTADRFAQPYSWYYHYWWFDMIMHFAGGFFVALTAFYLYFHSNYVKPLHDKAGFVILLALGAGAVVGIFWEFFEFAIDLYTRRTFNGITIVNQKVGDTLSDLFFDMFGAVTASVIFLRLWQKK